MAQTCNTKDGANKQATWIKKQKTKTKKKRKDRNWTVGVNPPTLWWWTRQNNKNKRTNKTKHLYQFLSGVLLYDSTYRSGKWKRNWILEQF